MKEGIHPQYNKIKVTCVCGHSFETGSTTKEKEIRVEICNFCHPLTTGKQKIIDSGGRVEKFNNRFKQKS